ncbi:asparagine synthase [Candidatus Saccharibacteria bacterium]|nr:asparagine synthase [Candidatus Saccharibacteria bacterium]
MQEDRIYCSSSFLSYRTVADKNKCFSLQYPPAPISFPSDRTPITTSKELKEFLKKEIEKKTKGKKVALALSGGIDSAILLNYMPKNTNVYTFKCLVPGISVTDETKQAKKYLEIKRPELNHQIIPIYWEDFEKYAPLLMKQKGAPIHSIEVQIHKAALKAKADGCDLFVFGETADCIYGGHSKLLAKDYSLPEFFDRWTFVPPEKALKKPQIITEPIKRFEKNGLIDVPEFLAKFVVKASYNSYYNACKLADIEFYAPYAYTFMQNPLDLDRVRRGESKYLLRELFSNFYPNLEIPAKLPMPRPMGEWLKDWAGPARPEFIPHCTDQMTGDQKYYVWILEKFLNLISKEKK